MATRTVSILKMGFAEPELLANYGDYVRMVRRKLPEPQQTTTRVIDPSARPQSEPQGIESPITTG